VRVLLLHAFPLDERMWKPQEEALADHHVSAPRLYGRGPTMDAWADSVAGESDGDLAVVGASMGGYCGLALTRRAPERVRGLLLLGARPDADSEERRAGRADTIDLISTEGPEALWRSMVPKLFADEQAADDRLLYRDADALVGAVEAIRDREDSTAVVREFARPVQFVVGEADPFVSADELREFDVREIREAGHLANVERPDEFNEILRDFLARV
jgi:pimeloyl-ACP methyl ester carboxylesterase